MSAHARLRQKDPIVLTISGDHADPQQEEPRQRRPPSPHDGFFKQTLAFKRLARIFLRERLPAGVEALLDPGDPWFGETEFVDDNLRRLLLDKVLFIALKDRPGLLLWLVIEAKSGADPLAIPQLALYCSAVHNSWYRNEREKEKAPSTPGTEASAGGDRDARPLRASHLWRGDRAGGAI